MLSAAANALLLAGLALPSAALPWVQLEASVPVHQAARSSWAKGDRPPQDHEVTVTVVLRLDEGRREELERTFWEVSDPTHPRYGRHLNSEALAKLLAVPEERAERVRSYFLAAGAREAAASPSRDMISVVMPVRVAEAALQTTLHLYSHKERRQTQIVRASAGYSLPADIARDVMMVGELLQFPRLRPKSTILQAGPKGRGRWPNACDAAACRGLVTPAVLSQRYKLGQGNATNGNSMAVAEFQGQYFKPRDLADFGKSCHRSVAVDKVVGGNKPEGGVESELDIEYIKAVAPEIPLTVIYNSEYSLLKWANEIDSMQQPPLVHSVSYGNDEAQQTGAEYMYACNTAFMKAGARGISILFASGDQGVCGREGCGVFSFHFHPDFPAASPYITAVGGTDFNGDNIGPETAWSASGGGFSDTFSIPGYQSAAVRAYKSSPAANLPPQKFWNGTGRGYPDVAALGGTKTPYCVRTGGSFQGVAGTSASSPVVAGVFAKLNGLRLARGRAPLGFLNPFIYQNPTGFQDVTSGKNSNGRKYGFTAVKGWDAATGFGTPDFQALSKLVMALDGKENDVLVI
uniref:subtilisin n=1 Tax=Alexandrium monilatum TaxID=311494 RepID=A0A7S4Q8B6_9DINO|mmetsp:Transcript_41951/g.125496  ORF Transcript_41951/g.125496 Transcript_41951/m.125496 type:complete len:576 (+) Transcript_41951:56-1783(+)